MKTGVLIRLLEKLELFLYRRAKSIVVVTESFKEDLESRGIDSNKISVVRNGVDMSRYGVRPRSAELARRYGVDGKFVVAYFGTHGMAHALENVLDTAELLADDSAIVFLLVGNGARKEALQSIVSERDIRNVVFGDPVAKETMPDLWSICDVALVHLKDDPVFSTVIPSKLFEAMGMAKPVMIVQPDGEAADLVRQYDAGEWVPPSRPEALSLAIREWKREPERVATYGRNALLAAVSNSREQRASEMADILRSCVKK